LGFTEARDLYTFNGKRLKNKTQTGIVNVPQSRKGHRVDGVPDPGIPDFPTPPDFLGSGFPEHSGCSTTNGHLSLGCNCKLNGKKKMKKEVGPVAKTGAALH